MAAVTVGRYAEGVNLCLALVVVADTRRELLAAEAAYRMGEAPQLRCEFAKRNGVGLYLRFAERCAAERFAATARDGTHVSFTLLSSPTLTPGRREGRVAGDPRTYYELNVHRAGLHLADTTDVGVDVDGDLTFRRAPGP